MRADGILLGAWFSRGRGVGEIHRKVGGTPGRLGPGLRSATCAEAARLLGLRVAAPGHLGPQCGGTVTCAPAQLRRGR